MPHIKWNSLPIDPDWPEIKPSQYARLHGLSTSYVRKLCNEGRLKGARRVIRYWVIPRDAKIEVAPTK
jgi:hypothetical protein